MRTLKVLALLLALPAFAKPAGTAAWQSLHDEVLASSGITSGGGSALATGTIGSTQVAVGNSTGQLVGFSTFTFASNTLSINPGSNLTGGFVVGNWSMASTNESGSVNLDFFNTALGQYQLKLISSTGNVLAPYNFYADASAGTGTFISNAASGQNAFSTLNNGARHDFGAGANDYASSDGTNVNYASPVASAAGATNATSPLLLSGELNINSTPVGNGADTTEDNLMTYTLPANSLNANNRAMRVTAWGSGTSTTDVETVKCYFGATVVLTRILTASQADTWHAVYEVIRSGASAEVASGVFVNGGAVVTTVQSNASPAENTANTIVIKCTGQRATTSSASSVQQLGMIVEFFN